MFDDYDYYKIYYTINEGFEKSPKVHCKIETDLYHFHAKFYIRKTENIDYSFERQMIAFRFLQFKRS